MSDTVRNLYDIACPACGSDESLMVVITTWAELSADGTDPAGDHDWDDQSHCRCSACNHHGKVKDFRIRPDGSTGSRHTETDAEAATHA